VPQRNCWLTKLVQSNYNLIFLLQVHRRGIKNQVWTEFFKVIKIRIVSRWQCTNWIFPDERHLSGAIGVFLSFSHLKSKALRWNRHQWADISWAHVMKCRNRAVWLHYRLNPWPLFTIKWQNSLFASLHYEWLGVMEPPSTEYKLLMYPSTLV